MKPKNAPISEFELLNEIVTYMEEHGANRDVVRFNIDEEIGQKLEKSLQRHITLEEIERVADKCFANEWLAHGSIGERYKYLKLTSAGHGVVRSKRAKQEQLAGRSLMKRTSDYIDDHKGILTALAIVIAILGLLIKGTTK